MKTEKLSKLLYNLKTHFSTKKVHHSRKTKEIRVCGLAIFLGQTHITCR